MKKLLLLFPLCLFFLGNMQAQTGTIRGEVFDENGLLPGVDIIVEETKQQLSTDSDGAFDLKLPPGNYTLAFNFPGYEKAIENVGLAEESTANVEVEMQLKKEKKFFLCRWFKN